MSLIINSNIKPCKSHLRWVGSKGLHLDKIYQFFPVHTTFVDVFGGGGSVLLGKTPSKIDVYNDLDCRLTTFFKVASDSEKLAKLIERLDNTLYSRRQFDESKAALEYGGLNDIDIAYHFFVINRQSFGGLGDNFGYSSVLSIPNDFQSSIRTVKIIHNRLKNMHIENLCFRELIPRYDSPQTLFYLDPPYVYETRTSHKCYVFEMTDSDHEDLLNLIMQAQGKCIISGFDSELYRRLEDDGWKKHTFEAAQRIKNTDGVCQLRTECVWVCPKAQASQQQPSLFSF